jgi:outer membrane protein assembly factor BamB
MGGMSPLDRETGLAQTASVDLCNTISPTRSIGHKLTLSRLFLCMGVIFVSLSQAFSAVDPATDWPAWRGPTRDGIAAPGQNLPLHWSETEGVLWKSPMPGRGHGSPTVVGDRVYLATSDAANQSVLCLNRNTGQRVWETKVHGGQADPGHHSNSSAASSTVACDGTRLYINFLNGGAVYTSALDLNGKLLWQQKVCDFVTHQGFGSSPVLYASLVIVSADNRGGGVIAALNRETGDLVWSQPRPKIPNYTSPAIVQAAGRTQVVLAGCNLISSFDPANGKKLWELNGSTEECVVTPVTDGTRIFTSGGYPKNHTVAVFADGSSKVAWQNTARVYVPSMIQKEGYLYAVMDAGLAVCWTADTGAEMWKERLGGDFFASPVMVGNRIYATNLRAKTFVFEATPKHFELLAQNQLGDEAYASQVICGSRIYLRVAAHADKREEHLYCIGNASAEKGYP